MPSTLTSRAPQRPATRDARAQSLTATSRRSRQLSAISSYVLDPILMVIARDALALGDLLVLHRRLQHHAVGELVDDPTLDLLPGSLVTGIVIAAVTLQVRAPLVE